MRTYCVMYKKESWHRPSGITVEAKSKESAYYKVVFDMFEGKLYSAWVEGYTDKKGVYHWFNTCEGLAY